MKYDSGIWSICMDLGSIRYEAKHKTKTMKKIMRLIAAIVVGVAAIGTGGCTHNGPADAPEIGCDSVTIRVCTIDKKTRKAILHPRFSVEYIDSEGNSRIYDKASGVAIDEPYNSRYWIYEDETGEYGEWKIGLPKNGDYDLIVNVACMSLYTDKFGHLGEMPNYRWKGGNAKVNTRDLRGKTEYTFPDVVLEPTTKEELESEGMKGVIKFFKEQLDLW